MERTSLYDWVDKFSYINHHTMSDVINLIYYIFHLDAHSLTSDIQANCDFPKCVTSWRAGSGVFHVASAWRPGSPALSARAAVAGTTNIWLSASKLVAASLVTPASAYLRSTYWRHEIFKRLCCMGCGFIDSIVNELDIV